MVRKLYISFKVNFTHYALRIFTLTSIFFVTQFAVKAQHTMHKDSILEGKITQQNLAENYNWFNNGKQQYKPNDSIVNELKPYVKDLTFIVVLGTWCGDSKEHVPYFYKLMQVLKINDAQIELIGVDRKKKSSYLDITPLNIEYVPTFIVFYKGKEAGRIIEDTKESLEKDLLQILRQYIQK